MSDRPIIQHLHGNHTPSGGSIKPYEIGIKTSTNSNGQTEATLFTSTNGVNIVPIKGAEANVKVAPDISYIDSAGINIQIYLTDDTVITIDGSYAPCVVCLCRNTVDDNWTVEYDIADTLNYSYVYKIGNLVEDSQYAVHFITADSLGSVNYLDAEKADKVELDKKQDKQTWSTLLTATTTEDAVFQLDDTSAGVDLNSYSEIEILIHLPSALTGRPHFNWYYGGSYSQDITATLNSSDCHYTVIRFKKYFGLWWAECVVSDTQTRLNIVHKSVYRDGITNLVMANFEGVRLFITRGSPAVNNLPSGTKIRVRGLK